MRRRILGNYIIILIISALLSGALAFYFINSSYINSKAEKLSTNISLIENNLKNTYANNEDVNFYALAQSISKNINSRVTFVDLEGNPISDSINNSIIFKNKENNTDFRLGMKGSNQIISSFSTEVGKKYFYLSKAPIRVGNRYVMLRLGDSNNEVYEIINEFFRYFLIANLISIFIAIIISFISSGKIVKPIKELTLASKDIAKGNFKSKTKFNSKDEIGELSKTFNQMAMKLEENISRIQEKNIQMNSILSSIQEGILALDLDKRVFLINNSMNRILEKSIYVKKGQYIGTVLNDIGDIEKIEEKLNDIEDYYDEIEISRLNKIISISIYPINQEEKKRIGTMIVIRDITQMRKLESIRKDFVANVSHELRTPLTSIGGFVETLKIKNLNEEDKKKALDIIELETSKLKNMINELLQLSKIESIKNTEEDIQINIKDEIKESLNMLNLRIKEKNIIVNLNIEEKLNKIYGHTELFRLIFINIVENSIKYNRIDGRIDIIVSNFENGIKLIVEDNGIGISAEDLPSIFKRFYRAKAIQSQNKKRKGTGLGLSIVNEIVTHMDGNIEVSSELEKGTRFEVILRG